MFLVRCLLDVRLWGRCDGVAWEGTLEELLPEEVWGRGDDGQEHEAEEFGCVESERMLGYVNCGLTRLESEVHLGSVSIYDLR